MIEQIFTKDLMKYLLAVILLSCASHHHPMVLGTTTETEVAQSRKSDGHCATYGEQRYCQWDGEVFVMKGNILSSTLTKNQDPYFYEVQVNFLNDGTPLPQSVKLVPASKKISENSLEWRKQLPHLVALFAARNIQVTKDGEQKVLVNFGLLKEKDEFKRHFDMKAVTADGVEIWKIEIRSEGSLADLSQIMEVLAFTAQESLRENKSFSGMKKFSDNLPELLAYRDYLTKRK